MLSCFLRIQALQALYRIFASVFVVRSIIGRPSISERVVYNVQFVANGERQVFYVALTVFPIQDITAVDRHSASSGPGTDLFSIENAKNPDPSERLEHHSGVCMYSPFFFLLRLSGSLIRA